VRILAIDIGTGTQDILLFDSEIESENCLKMVMPAPTAILARQVRRATAVGQGLVLSGVTMGGGPVGWALGDHLKSGLAVYATPDAARTINDDLAEVASMGVTVVDERDVAALARRSTHLVLRDLDLPAIWRAFGAFDVEARCDGLAVAVLDHGNAPPGVSDRAFRFDHIRSVVAATAGGPDQLLAFSYTPDDLPAYLTRMQAIVNSAGKRHVPMVLLDTGAAAALGALQDEEVSRRAEVVLVNLGNMHALATHLVRGRIIGLFEHHTGFISSDKLDRYLAALIGGQLDNRTIFDDNGHGCYIVDAEAARSERPFVAVTGPKRALARGSQYTPYFAVPHGDMMIAGCFGLVRAFNHRHRLTY
jgi:uncharacterized protein (DUF1786 family)